jgi:hypothetical protein
MVVFVSGVIVSSGCVESGKERAGVSAQWNPGVSLYFSYF